MEKKIHLFEVAGLGKAPFHVLYMYSLPPKSLAEANPTAYNNALSEMPKDVSVGMCHYCGHDLINNFIVKSADGKKFVVGCECVNKAGDTGMKSEMSLIKKRIAREIKREKDRLEVAKRIADANARKEAKEENEREKNHGYTDEEIKNLILKRKVAILHSLAVKLEDGKNGFRDSVADGLKQGILPNGRGMDIMLDILSKSGGKYNSKGYNVEYDKINEVIHNAIKPMNIPDCIDELLTFHHIIR